MQKEKLINAKYPIYDNINEKLQELKRRLKSFPRSAETISEKSERFKDCLYSYNKKFKKLMKEINDSSEFNMESEICQMLEIFQKTFEHKRPKFFSNEFAVKVEQIIKKTSGLKLPNFLDNKIFNKIIGEEIKHATKDIYSVLDKISSYVQQKLIIAADNSFKTYPMLHQAVVSEIKNSIIEQQDEIKKNTDQLLDMEKSLIFTKNKYYNDTRLKIIAKITNHKHNKEVDLSVQRQIQFGLNQITNDNTFTEINDVKIENSELFSTALLKSSSESNASTFDIQISCFAYWKVFEKRFIDYYEMTIIYNFVRFYKIEFANCLDKRFSPTINEHTKDYIVESPQIVKERKKVEKSIHDLTRASDELKKII